MENSPVGVPLAIPIMILIGSMDINTRITEVQLLISPLYGCNACDKLIRGTKCKYASHELRCNGCTKIAFHDYDDPQLGNPRATCRVFYQRIFENRHRFNFACLVEFMNHYYSCDMQKIESMDDIRDCYRIMVENAAPATGKDFTYEFCWKTAGLFLDKKAETYAFSDKRQFYLKRREMIKNASGIIRMSGTTLKHAFSTSAELRDDSVIYEIFGNANITDVYVYMLNYSYINLTHESASREIENTIENIFNMINNYPRAVPIRFHITLLSDFSIPFTMMTESGIVMRNMYLFNKSRDYCGEFLYFGRSDKPDSEYDVLKKYLTFLYENAYKVDINPKGEEKMFKIKQRLIDEPKLRKYVEMLKTHPVQMENLVRKSFVGQSPKDETPMTDFLQPDDTQRVLIPFLQETEAMLDEIVKTHDRSGWAKVVPSVDLGFSSNVVRMAGGFFAGALYDWSCSVPIVPIDASVNTCTCSVFKLAGFDEHMSDAEFNNIIEKMNAIGAREGYSFNFRSYNHFFTVAKDEEDGYYILIHTSAREGIDNTFGLYPGGDRTWFTNEIKTKLNRSQTRYMRYIRGNSAIRLIDYSMRFRQFNEHVHKFIASEFGKLCGVHTEQLIMRHLYGMPTSSSIAIGTFAVDIFDSNLLVPVFPAGGKSNICLFRVSSEQSHTYRLAGTSTEYVTVPYCYGSIFEGIRGISIENPTSLQEKSLLIDCTDGLHRFPVNGAERISNIKEKCMRRYPDVMSFLGQNSRFFSGSIEKILTPIKTYPDV